MINVVVLSDTHSKAIEKFTCIEDDSNYGTLTSKQRKRIRSFSKEMDDFLKKEALKEQNSYFNTTHIIYDSDSDEIMGFVSLCNDSIRLDINERKECSSEYETLPAIKIARLATHTKYQKKGIATLLIQYAVHLADNIRLYSGLKYITLDCYKHRLEFYKNKGFNQNLLYATDNGATIPISMRLNIDDYLAKLHREKHINKNNSVLI